MSDDESTLRRLSLETCISAKNVQELRAMFKRHVDAGVCTLELDFSSVETVDSVGIGLLVATHNSLSKAGGRLSLTGVGHDLYQLFALMRLDKHFSISPAGVEV